MSQRPRPRATRGNPGGYSKRRVVREEFVLRVPDGLDLSNSAPLLCAGISTYWRLRTWSVGWGSCVGGQCSMISNLTCHCRRWTASWCWWGTSVRSTRSAASRCCSPIGGIAETQELLDFCGKKNILPECEMIRMDEINHAVERMERSDVRYRFVIDLATLS